MNVLNMFHVHNGKHTSVEGQLDILNQITEARHSVETF